jgi:phenylpyruvate tautomerase PptA (4-oxalocrotonate tautomerase family)
MHMPHVTVKMRPGRSGEERAACAKAVAAAIADTMENTENEPMIVTVVEVPEGKWKQRNRRWKAPGPAPNTAKRRRASQRFL